MYHAAATRFPMAAVSVRLILSLSSFFVTFTGEEALFKGSRHFLQEAPGSVRDASVMINLDMVGRMKDSGLTIAGLGTLEDSVAETVRSYLDGSGLEPEVIDPIQDGSDHRVFYRAGVPVLHMTTGIHSDAHRISDTPEKLDMLGVEAVAKVVAGMIKALDGGGR